MRRIAAVLVLLLTATAARAGIEDYWKLDAITHGVSCCAVVLCFGIVALNIVFAVYARRQARRPTPPVEDE